MSRILPIFFFFAVLTGCSINKPIQTLDTALISDDSFGEYELYADLVKQSGQWRFTNINASSGEILLNNMTLHGLAQTDYSRCHRGLFGLTSGNCEVIESNWLSYKPMARNLVLFPISWALAPIGIPLSWSIGDFTDIDVFFFPIQVIPSYDNEELRTALDEASHTSQESDLIGELGALYYDIKEKSNDAKYEYPESNTEILSNLVNEFNTNQKQAAKSYLKGKLTLLVDDKSDLLTRKAPNPNYLAKPIIKIPELKRDLIYPEIKPLTETNSLTRGLFPADNLAQLQTRLIDARNKLNDIEKANNSAYYENIKLIKQANTLNEQRFDQFKKDSLNNKFTIDWEISPSVKFLLKDMDYTIELPPSLALSQSELDIEPYLKLTVNSITFKPRLPDGYHVEDNHLKAALSKDHITFTNKSDREIKLSTAKLSLNGLAVDIQIDEALEASKTYEHQLLKKELKTFSPLFTDLTSRSANNTNLVTDLTVNYIVAGNSGSLESKPTTSKLIELLQD